MHPGGRTSALQSDRQGRVAPWYEPQAPSKLSWIVAILAVIVQLGAFVDIPDMVRGAPNTVQFENPNYLNTVFSSISLICIVIACGLAYRKIVHLAAMNKIFVAYTCLVAVSAVWSIHPELTLRRSIGYILFVLVAAYLSVAFAEKDRMKVFSWAFSICAIGSLLFVVAYPEYGITHATIYQPDEIDGSWRGVFAQKNGLGGVMAVAIFVELYLCIEGKGKPWWRWGLVALFFLLVLLSESLTGLLAASVFFTGFAICLIARYNKFAGMAVAVILVLLIFLLSLGIWYGTLFNFFGKDPTLTGRTDIWLAVVDFIKQRPLVGRGFMATWVPTDPEVYVINHGFGWVVPDSHNAFLEVTLQLGLLGLGLVIAISGIAWARAVRCWKRGIFPLGWFSMVFVVAALLVGISEAGLGLQKSIAWLMLSVLSFSCGLSLLRSREGESLVDADRRAELRAAEPAQ